jgi:hypothetical protein
MKRIVEGQILKWGLDRETGALRHINEVRNGKNCDCLCPDDGCNSLLEAVHPDKNNNRTPHFRHRAAEDGRKNHCKNQKGAVESAIHKIAKEVILNAGRMYLYPYKHSFPPHKGKRLQAFTINKFPTNSRTLLKDLELEKRIFSSDYQPDLSCFVEGTPFAIEIKRTHAVGLSKVDQFKSDKIAAIEIDLSRVTGDFDRHTIQQAINEPRNFYWLSFPKQWITPDVSTKLEAHFASEKKRIVQLVAQEKRAAELERIREEEYLRMKAEAEKLARQTEAADRLMLLIRDLIGTYNSEIIPFTDKERAEIKECYRNMKRWSVKFASIVSTKTEKKEDIWTNKNNYEPSLREFLDNKLKESKRDYIIGIKGELAAYFEERLELRLKLTDSMMEAGWNGAALRLDSLHYSPEEELSSLIFDSVIPLLKEKIEKELISLGVQLSIEQVRR